MSANTRFLFTSGRPSVLNDSMDYGIKDIDTASWPQDWIKNLQNFCQQHLEQFSTMSRQSNGNFATIVGKTSKSVSGKKTMFAIPIQVTAGKDHVNRDNIQVTGKVLYDSFPLTEPAWEIIPAGGKYLTDINICAWIHTQTDGQESKILSKIAASLPGEKKHYLKIKGMEIHTLRAAGLCFGIVLMIVAIATGTGWVWNTLIYPDPNAGIVSRQGGWVEKKSEAKISSWDREMQAEQKTAILWKVKRTLQSSRCAEKIQTPKIRNWAEHDERLNQLLVYLAKSIELMKPVTQEIDVSEADKIRGKLRQGKANYRDLDMFLQNYTHPDIEDILVDYAYIQENLQLYEKSPEQRTYAKILVRNEILQNASAAMEWLVCFFPEDRSILPEMPDGGETGKPEDSLRQYLEYCYPKLKVLTDSQCWFNKAWKNSLEQLAGEFGIRRLDELSQQIHKAYFDQTCEESSRIANPPTHLDSDSPKKIKAHAWAAYQRVKTFVEKISESKKRLE